MLTGQPPRVDIVPRAVFFFWAFPTAWLDLAHPMDPDEILAIIRVLPHETPGLAAIEPSGQPTWPKYMPAIPEDADAICARNFVAIARAIEIQQIVLHPERHSPPKGYGRTIRPESYAERPIAVTASSWSVSAHTSISVWAEYESVRVSRYCADKREWISVRFPWHQPDARERTVAAVAETLATLEEFQRRWCECSE
ncbi:MAG: hypothetical protein KatS3mg087_1079 [Patescibacteria group bacterium]|nr:MAG: hypothetical protein KatS3mg087_1079 [Patescibacteria group bacterium]